MRDPVDCWHHRQVRKPRPPKRSTVITTIVVVVLALAGAVAYVVVAAGVFDPSVSEQIDSVEKAQGSWWLGKQFDGLPEEIWEAHRRVAAALESVE